MGLSDKECKLIDILINNVGLSISELYGTLVYNSENILALKEYTDFENTIYKGLNLSTEKCEAITKYVEKKYVSCLEQTIAEKDDEMDASFYVMSLNRLLNHIKYYSKGINYSLNGYLQHVVDFMVQILYSELIRASYKYPDYEKELMDYAYTRLNMSPIVEKEMLKNKLVPLEKYDNNISIFIGAKKHKTAIEFTKIHGGSLIDAPMLEVNENEIYLNSLKKVIEPDINDAFKEMINNLDNRNSAYFIIQAVTFKSLIAMYSQDERQNICKDYLNEIHGITDDNDIIDYFEELFAEIEVEIIPKIVNIRFLTLKRR